MTAPTPAAIPDKRCTKCGEVFPPTTTHFLARPKNRNGLSAECRTCNYARSVQWQKNNRDKVNARKRDQWAAGTGGYHARNARYYAANKAKVIAHIVQKNREKRENKRVALSTRRCLECRITLAKRQNESWAQFEARTLCGALACLKRHSEAQAFVAGQATRQKALAQTEERDRQAQARELARYDAQLQAEADRWAASGTITRGLCDKRGKSENWKGQAQA